jgi:hypothetical protein
MVCALDGPRGRILVAASWDILPSLIPRESHFSLRDAADVSVWPCWSRGSGVRPRIDHGEYRLGFAYALTTPPQNQVASCLAAREIVVAAGAVSRTLGSSGDTLPR